MGNMYRCYESGGGYYFITINAFQRQPILTTPNIRQSFKHAVAATKLKFPFDIHALVLLPDHLHMVLSTEDDLLSKRLGYLKMLTTKYAGIKQSEMMTENYKRDRRCVLWQPRFWERTIRTESQLHSQIMYCYINPVHHGYVDKVGDWPYSTFHRDVKRGLLPPEWSGISVDLKPKKYR